MPVLAPKMNLKRAVSWACVTLNGQLQQLKIHRIHTTQLSCCPPLGPGTNKTHLASAPLNWTQCPWRGSFIFPQSSALGSQLMIKRCGGKTLSTALFAVGVSLNERKISHQNGQVMHLTPPSSIKLFFSDEEIEFWNWVSECYLELGSLEDLFFSLREWNILL